MAITTQDPKVSDSSTILLVEDQGLRSFLPMVLGATSIAAHDLNVVGGAGWADVYKRYDELIHLGIDPSRIVPILDADTVGQKSPPSEIVNSENLFRFPFDFELSFSAGECRLLDHALLLLLPGVFGVYGSVEALNTWTSIVDRARIQTVTSGGTTLNNVEDLAKVELSNRGKAPESLALPSKVKLAEILAELCLATGTLSEDLTTLLHIVEAHVNRRDCSPVQYHPRPLWRAPLASLLPHSALHLRGKVLYDAPRLRLADLAATGKQADIPGAEDLYGGSWIKGNRIVATRAKSDGVVIARGDDPKDRSLLRQGIRESFLCWNQTANRVLLRDQNEQVYSVSEDSQSWSKIRDVDGYSHCLNRKEMLAWTTHDYREIRIRALNDTVKPSRVPDVIDGRHGIAWSHNGTELAFINADEVDSRRTICVWNRASNLTRFIMPWIGKVDSICWSPDDRFILFHLVEADGFFLIDARVATIRPIPEILRVSDQGGRLRCRSWKL